MCVQVGLGRIRLSKRSSLNLVWTSNRIKAVWHRGSKWRFCRGPNYMCILAPIIMLYTLSHRSSNIHSQTFNYTPRICYQGLRLLVVPYSAMLGPTQYGRWMTRSLHYVKLMITQKSSNLISACRTCLAWRLKPFSAVIVNVNALTCLFPAYEIYY